jgi:peptide-methionine (R)-S-oxide reductase
MTKIAWIVTRNRTSRYRETVISSQQKAFGAMAVTRRHFLTVGVVTALSVAEVSACAASAMPSPSDAQFSVTHTDTEWRNLLSPAQYSVLRQAGTESPFSSPLNDEHRHGVFSCAGCALPLYSSDTKFDSGTGWPSFWKALDNSVLERPDTSLGVTRTEVLCSRCGSHLGHVFDDGPPPTGLRYCMNGVAMTFAAQ